MTTSTHTSLAEKELAAIALEACIFPGSTIQSVEIVPHLDTWAVEIAADKRPIRILIGEGSLERFSPEMWPALTLHEAAHSSATYYMASSVDWPKQLAQDITNILEDARIEHDIVKEYPGSALSFSLLNTFCFEEFKRWHEMETNEFPIHYWTDIFHVLLAQKFSRSRFVAVASGPSNEQITLPNGDVRNLDLQEMLSDALQLMKAYVEQPCAFSDGEAIRRGNNRFAVNLLNAFLDKYAWVARNEMENAVELSKQLTEHAKAFAPGASLTTKEQHKNELPEICAEELSRNGSHLEASSRDKTQQEMVNDMDDFLEEISHGNNDVAYNTQSLGSLYNEARARELLVEVDKLFPVKPPQGKAVHVENRKRTYSPSEDGDLDVDAVIEWVANCRPKGALLCKDGVLKRKPTDAIKRPPPPGDKFPIKRVAIYLDLSSSMYGGVTDIIAFSAAFSMFARKHLVDILFVVGDQGVALVRQGNSVDMNNVLNMNLGNAGNAPTWTPGSMLEAYQWVKEKGRVIFVTDRAVQLSENHFIDMVLKQGLGISLQQVNIKEMADLLWKRRSCAGVAIL